jgi:glycosyltransferase involved in cell wall biosynthesis
VAIGRLIEKKGFSDLIDSCAILAEQGVEFHCEIIGTGDQESDLRSRIDRFGLRKRVDLTGALPQQNVIQRLQNAAVFVAPCVIGIDGNRDGIPTVLLEAMALGAPCISTDVTGIPEVVQHEETGLIVPQRNPAALADSIIRLLADRSLRNRLSQAARILIENKFDIVSNSARLRNLFRQVLSKAA